MIYHQSIHANNNIYISKNDTKLILSKKKKRERGIKQKF